MNQYWITHDIFSNSIRQCCVNKQNTSMPPSCLCFAKENCRNLVKGFQHQIPKALMVVLYKTWKKEDSQPPFC